jgi:hypothetical protein
MQMYTIVAYLQQFINFFLSIYVVFLFSLLQQRHIPLSVIHPTPSRDSILQKEPGLFATPAPLMLIIYIP